MVPRSQGGDVWRGHFPALTDGAAAAGIRAPRGLDLAHRGGSVDVSALIPTPPSFSCSEGVFKCPEDQLPLDYAKVSPMGMSPCPHCGSGPALVPGTGTAVDQQPFVLW